MKILLLTDRLDRGGVETHVETLAMGLQGSGCKVIVLSAGGEIAKRLEQAGILHYLMPPPSHSVWGFLRRRRILKKLLKREQFDVLHAHTRLTALLLRTVRARVRIVTVHAKFKSSPLARLLSYWGTHTVAVSEDLAAHTASTFGVMRKKILVIPNGINLSRFAPKAQNKSTPHVLFASRLDSDCSLGAHLLISLCEHPALVPYRPRITLAGGGDAYAALKKQAEEVNRRLGYCAITLLGHVESMSPLLAAHGIFVGVSRAAMEAAAAGCAVILCGNEGYLGLLSERTLNAALSTNLCCRGAGAASKEALLCDLLPLIRDSAKRQAAGNAMRALARTHFSDAQMCASHLALYRAAAPPLSICIGGYFGCENLGDDLILEGFLSYMQAKHPTVRLHVLTDAAAPPAHVHAVRRRAPFSILWAFCRSHAFLCGGGSLLQNKTGNLSLVYYLTLLRLCALLDCRPILYAAGIGPLSGAMAKKQTASALSRCPYVSLRDPDSQNTLQEMGLPPARLHLGADAALLLPSPPVASHKHAPFLCIIPHGNKMPRILLEGVRTLQQKHRMPVRILLFDRLHDAESALEASRALAAPIARPRSYWEAAGLLCNAALVVSGRLHGLILSLLCRVPAIGLCHDPRDPKIASFAQMCALPVLSSGALSGESFCKTAEEMLCARADLSVQLSKHLSFLRKKAEKDLANLMDLLYNERDNT